MRFYLQLGALLSGVAVAFIYKHREPAPVEDVPVVSSLPMPQTRKPRPSVADSMLIKPESRETPQFLKKPGIPSDHLALARDPDDHDLPRGLDPKRAVAAIAAAFAVVYVILARSLRR